MLPISKDSLNGEDAMKLQVTFGDFAEIGSAASDVSEELTEAFHLDTIVDNVDAGMPGLLALSRVTLAVARLQAAKEAIVQAANEFAVAAFEAERDFAFEDGQGVNKMYQVESVLERSPYYSYGED